ncbi:MAG: ATP-binding cassette domain-containing protein, partial [Lachnospiraceae bacterium]|nr:ATP-binding cassette domain-containing protein [Lachnospiraceae bacterium]
MEQDILLSIRDLEVQFDLRGQTLTAIRGISLDVYAGETLAIVGESGSGKSVLTKTFNGLLDANGRITKGSILYQGRDLAKFVKEKDWLSVRGREIAMIMQDPMTSLNPLKTIGEQIREAVTLRKPGISKADSKLETLQYLADVGIDDP